VFGFQVEVGAHGEPKIGFAAAVSDLPLGAETNDEPVPVVAAAVVVVAAVVVAIGVAALWN